jgi:dTDP-4-amino-4,6-dideoxygalactose transaminase
MNVKLLDLQGQYLFLRAEIRRAIDEVCDAQSFTLGPGVERFEKKLAAYCGVKHAIGVSSGTDALLCAMMAMNIQPGDEVICPAFTFFATAGSIARLGARPVFADIDPRTFNLDPHEFEARITPRTKAVIPVHLFGQMADMEAINRIAARHGLLVLEDAAQAIGARQGASRACALGWAGCLSFYPTKNLGGFGDGGAICCNDDDFDRVCRLLRVHGSGQQYQHKLLGGMFRLDALQAAVLEVKLKYLDSWHEGRRRNAQLYDRLLAGSPVKTPVVQTPYIAPGNYCIYNQYCVRVPDRDAVKQRLAEQGVGTAVYYPIPLHLQECFASLGHRSGDFPHSEQACREILALPIYPELTEPEITCVAQQLLASVR